MGIVQRRSGNTCRSGMYVRVGTHVRMGMNVQAVRVGINVGECSGVGVGKGSIGRGRVA
jgi:hypothetical protein